jgi:polyhydroxyalkanoate synthase
MLELARRTAATAQFLATDPVRSARVGQTPHAVIHRQGKAALRYFAPQGEARTAPVLVSMPLINTWTVWDLLPDRSVVRALTAAGTPVYLLDWGRPGPEDADRPLATYVDGLLSRAFDRAGRHAAARHGAEQLDAIGYCVGGTFLAAHLALHPDHARRMALVCAPIDFHASGRLAAWADPATFPLDTIVDSYGNFPADLMRQSFAWLKPMGQTRKWFGLWERIDDERFTELWAALEQWNGDNVAFPGEAYREYVRRCYFDNALMTGGWVLGGQAVDLGAARLPALALAASDDHICPPAAAHGLAAAWGGPVRTEVIKGGHVGVCVSSRLPRALTAWLQEA